MAIHLTPTELARESGLERRDVIVKCLELGVPIFNGRIDKTLFLSSLREITGVQQPQVGAAAASRVAGLRSRAPHGRRGARRSAAGVYSCAD